MVLKGARYTQRAKVSKGLGTRHNPKRPPKQRYNLGCMSILLIYDPKFNPSNKRNQDYKHLKKHQTKNKCNYIKFQYTVRNTKNKSVRKKEENAQGAPLQQAVCRGRWGTIARYLLCLGLDMIKCVFNKYVVNNITC